jgi:formylglycine-generating enzyme required for sulfatase activity
MTRSPGLVALAGCAFGAASCALVWGIDAPHPQADDAGTRVDGAVAEAGDATSAEAGDGSAVGEGGDARAGNDAGDAASSFDCPSAVLDAGTGDASPPSCAGTGPGLSSCGPNGESCCASAPVTGGTFYRGYDKVSYPYEANQATVSDFSLDKYEVTVGRFRKFVQATLATPPWQPCVGSGKHVHLADGGGLNGGSESGWQADWPPLPADIGQWTMDLSEPQCEFNATWTPDAGANESLPITCVSWYELYAFCIWDGGFLPTDAEWNYAAAGGSNQRAYPWSDPTSSYDIDCAHANVVLDSGACENQRMRSVGSLSPGVGQYSQFDLAGNVVEWVLDLYGDGGYFNPAPRCIDCALLSGTPSPERTFHGGSAARSASEALVSWRSHDTPTQAFADYGGRCARPGH